MILLSDGYLANGAEPWAVPSVAELPRIDGRLRDRRPTARTASSCPYLRDPETLARAWAIPGTAGLQHRVGGLEKADKTGNISYDPANHDFMTRTRQAKIDGIAATLPPTEVDDPDGDARVAVVGWGSTYGPIGAACRRVRRAGRSVAHIHLRHLNPFPPDLGEVLARYDRVVCPEMNLGQLSLLLRAKYLVDVAEPHAGPRPAVPRRRARRRAAGRHHRHRRHLMTTARDDSASRRPARSRTRSPPAARSSRS